MCVLDEVHEPVCDGGLEHVEIPKAVDEGL